MNQEQINKNWDSSKWRTADVAIEGARMLSDIESDPWVKDYRLYNLLRYSASSAFINHGHRANEPYSLYITFAWGDCFYFPNKKDLIDFRKFIQR